MYYEQCFIENVNGIWYIKWPDGAKAWSQGYKTKGWATRTLKQLTNVSV